MRSWRPVIPPYLFAALRGSSTITVSDQYDPIQLELSVFTEQPDIARVLKTQRSIREAQLRFSDVIACAGERQRALLLEELDALRSPHAAPPAVVNVPFGLPDLPPASTTHPLRERFPQIGPDDPVVLWWGKVWKWFDASTALRAFALVVARRPDARLVISAGKAPKARFDLSERTEDARDLARELGLLDTNVFFLDEWTEYDRRHEYLEDADIGLTLHADTPEAPFAARARYLDYLWSALPCVLASGDEIADRFGAAGFARLVAPGAPEEAAAALLRLIENADERQAARAAGLELAARFPLVGAGASARRGHRGPCRGRQPLAVAAARARRRALLRAPHGRPRLSLWRARRAEAGPDRSGGVGSACRVGTVTRCGRGPAADERAACRSRPQRRARAAGGPRGAHGGA